MDLVCLSIFQNHGSVCVVERNALNLHIGDQMTVHSLSLQCCIGVHGVRVERGIHGDIHGKLFTVVQRFQRMIRLETVSAAENEVRGGKDQNSQNDHEPDPAALFLGRGCGRSVRRFSRRSFLRGCLRAGTLFPYELPHEQNEQDQDRKENEPQCQPDPPYRQNRDSCNICLCSGNLKGQIVPENFAVRLFPASVLPGVDADVFNFVFGRCNV